LLITVKSFLTAFQDVEDNLSSLSILSAERNKLEAAVLTATKTLQFVINEYQAGTAQLSDVLNAEITLFVAQENAQCGCLSTNGCCSGFSESIGWWH